MQLAKILSVCSCKLPSTVPVSPKDMDPIQNIVSKKNPTSILNVALVSISSAVALRLRALFGAWL